MNQVTFNDPKSPWLKNVGILTLKRGWCNTTNSWFRVVFSCFLHKYRVFLGRFSFWGYNSHYVGKIVQGVKNYAQEQVFLSKDIWFVGLVATRKILHALGLKVKVSTRYHHPRERIIPIPNRVPLRPLIFCCFSILFWFKFF